MKQLELLAPARDITIGIAAIDCGADAVYIAGPQFGARQAAGNEIEDIRNLCSYAHKFGARIFVTLNTILYDHELESAYRQMLKIQEAGADAIIVQDMAVLEMAGNGLDGFRKDIRIPLHASTQCAIRTPEQAVFLESLGFSRLILERELSLDEIRAIRNAVSCELEFFVHGALCVCYSGQCYLSEKIAGRSANRGACIQACRSRYDLVDEKGNVIVKDKALLSLKDYNLRNRIGELAEAGITSFKIEGRLKNESYVRNVVRDYSLKIDDFISEHKEYGRGSYGKVHGGFTPDTNKTFNRGYTELFMDGRKGRWAAMDAAKSMGEEIGEVISLNADKSSMNIRFINTNTVLNNGDGFSFVARDGQVAGFRGDVCNGNSIKCKSIPSLYKGARIYRNINAAFEREIEKSRCSREIDVIVNLSFICSEGAWKVTAEATTEDGRKTTCRFDAGAMSADNPSRMLEIIEGQISKSSGIFRFRTGEIIYPDSLPFMKASSVNAIRRNLAERLDEIPCIRKEMMNRNLADTVAKELPAENISYKYNISNRLSRKVYLTSGATQTEDAYELSHRPHAELMRTRYCIRYELGICPVHHKAGKAGKLYLLNNGQRFALDFDCRNCEMTVAEV